MFHFIKRDPALSLAFKFGLFVCGSWFIVWIITLPDYFAGSTAGNERARGQFGDAFGSLNALFTGLALVGLGYAADPSATSAQRTTQGYCSTRNGRGGEPDGCPEAIT